MSLAFNPKDTNTFASASLDKTVKVWNIASSNPNFTLEGALFIFYIFIIQFFFLHVFLIPDVQARTAIKRA
jgi:WD40 repeat protein